MGFSGFLEGGGCCVDEDEDEMRLMGDYRGGAAGFEGEVIVGRGGDVLERWIDEEMNGRGWRTSCSDGLIKEE